MVRAAERRGAAGGLGERSSPSQVLLGRHLASQCRGESMARAWSVALAGERCTCPLWRRLLRSRLRTHSLRVVAGGGSATTVAAARSFTRGLFTSGVLLMQEGAPSDEARGGKAAAARWRRPPI